MDREVLKDVIREVLKKRLAAGLGEGEAGGEGVDLVTEDVVLAARRSGSGTIFLRPGALVTPLGREAAERYGIAIRNAPPKPTAATLPPEAAAAGIAARGRIIKGPIAIGCDHAGFELKETLKRFLEEEAGCTVIDFGTHSKDAVDYPDLAHQVAGSVGRGEAWRGIIIDGVGVGSAMAANRHPGVRAAALSGIIEVINAREHNDANVLCLGGRMIGDLLARALTVTFLNTSFGGGRHARRVQKIEIG